MHCDACGGLLHPAALRPANPISSSAPASVAALPTRPNPTPKAAQSLKADSRVAWGWRATGTTLGTAGWPACLGASLRCRFRGSILGLLSELGSGHRARRGRASFPTARETPVGAVRESSSFPGAGFSSRRRHDGAGRLGGALCNQFGYLIPTEWARQVEGAAGAGVLWRVQGVVIALADSSSHTNLRFILRATGAHSLQALKVLAWRH